MITLQKSISISFFLLGTFVLTSMAGLELASSLIILTALIYGLKTKSYGHFLKPILIAFIPLFISSLLSLALPNHWQAFFKTLGWYRWIIFFSATTYLLYWLPNARKMLFRGLSTGAILAFINSIVQYLTGYDFVRSRVIDYYADITKETTRVTGFFNLPTTFGYILAMFSFIPLSLFISKWGKKGNWFHGLIFLITFIMLIFTHTRGAWLAFLGGLFVFIFFTYRRLILPVTLTICALTTTLFFTHSGFQERISSLTNFKYYSNLQRIELWKANIAIFKDHPIIGVGLHQNDTLVEEYHKRLGHTESFVSHAHNSYLQFLSGTGLIGFLSFLLFLMTFVFIAYKNRQHIDEKHWVLVIGLIGAFITFLVCCLFDCNFRDAEVRYSFLTYMAVLTSITTKRNVPT